ncbi:LOW QUALITY PROTEIN: glyoxylase I 4 [Trifolium pratense]|uniref:LOW QUALITY PROTEIN: glyoxylase I 4 n=1 Tax=Trifolium pratense TaxID=57577 RepID=UPI001E697038|nr:LOW QUALITY PROTEIN: glyoxylase I 4 [Trifolium pratense]
MQKQDVREDGKKSEKNDQPPLMALNHISRLCRNVKESIDFYTKVLGFVLIERPPVLDFEGAWLFNYGVGIHLVQLNSKEEDKLPSDTQQRDLDPQDNHISFQCEDVEGMEKKLKEMNAEDETTMDQLFFNDPDGFMVEICNCENLKLIPANSRGKIKLPADRHTPPVETTNQNEHDNEK